MFNLFIKRDLILEDLFFLKYPFLAILSNFWIMVFIISSAFAKSFAAMAFLAFLMSPLISTLLCKFLAVLFFDCLKAFSAFLKFGIVRITYSVEREAL